jgi:hypothetical protein
MKKRLLTTARIAVIVVSTVVTIYAASSPEALGLLIAGMIVRNFFSSKIYDPIFKDQSAQEWLYKGIKKWAARKRPDLYFDI